MVQYYTILNIMFAYQTITYKAIYAPFLKFNLINYNQTQKGANWALN